MVRCNGASLLVYKNELLTAVKLVVHMVSKDIQRLSCLLVNHLLKALTLIYASDYRSTIVDWDLPLSDVLPIRVTHLLLLLLLLLQLLLLLLLLLLLQLLLLLLLLLKQETT